MSGKRVKPFLYLNCVVFSLFKVTSSSAEREREREREREKERDRDRDRDGDREMEYGVLSSVSFYLFCFSVVFRFDL